MKKSITIAILLLASAFNGHPQAFFGVNAGAALESTTNDATGIIIGAGVDFGFLNTSAGLWGLSASHNLSLGTANHTNIGILHLPQNWDDRTALFWGAGIDIRSAVQTPYGQTIEDNGTGRQCVCYRDNQGYGLMLRLGISFPNHFYLAGSIAFGAISANKDIYSMTYTAAGLHYDGFNTIDEDRSYLTLGLNIGYRF